MKTPHPLRSRDPEHRDDPDRERWAPRYEKIPDTPVDLDAVEAILRLGRAGTFGDAELRMRLRQVIG